jgi:hypothetical protein
MIKCLSPEQLTKFIIENNLIYFLDFKNKAEAIVVRSETGDVAWIWDAAKLLYCWS